MYSHAHSATEYGKQDRERAQHHEQSSLSSRKTVGFYRDFQHPASRPFRPCAGLHAPFISAGIISSLHVRTSRFGKSESQHWERVCETSNATPASFRSRIETPRPQ